MPIKSKSNQGDDDSALSVVDPVKPKTNYLRCMVGFGLASALLIITAILLIINVGVFAHLHARYANVPRFLDILMISSFVCRALAFINASRIMLQRSLFGLNKPRLAIVVPFLISACGSVLLGWMGRIIKGLFGIMFMIILPELIYTIAMLVAELAGKGKYFVVYKREGGNLHEVIDMEKGEKVIVESPDTNNNAEDPGKGLWLKDPPTLSVAPFSAPISISVN